MIFFLLGLSLRGSLIFLLVWILDQLSAWKMSARWRRIWWLLVPAAFLLPIHLSVLPTPLSIPVPDVYQKYVLKNPASLPTNKTAVQRNPFEESIVPWIGLLWLSGVAVSSTLVIVPTIRVQGQWSRQRPSTEPRLLNLLEDCKAIAGVTAPLGLIVSDEIAAPALLGWLRPRILLPTTLATSGSSHELKAVFLHELAHFKMLDIPINWFFVALRVAHWFNPMAYFACAAWARFREEAADENAIHWMNQPTGTAYGEILLKMLGECTGGSTPYGALAIGESIQTLKRRIVMIRHYTSKSTHAWLAATITLALSAILALSPSFAAEEGEATAKKEAVQAMQTWLGEIDGGDYAKSWSDASKSFQKAVTSTQWVAALSSVSAPDGKMLERKLASALYQSGVPTPGGQILQGQFVIAQFDSSFENLKYARETVTFEKEADGTWRASGYYIKPRP